jgi:hypothetical protein
MSEMLVSHAATAEPQPFVRCDLAPFTWANLRGSLFLKERS